MTNERVYQTHPKLLQVVQERTGGKNPPSERIFLLRAICSAPVVKDLFAAVVNIVI